MLILAVKCLKGIVQEKVMSSFIQIMKFKMCMSLGSKEDNVHGSQWDPMLLGYQLSSKYSSFVFCGRTKVL